MIGLGSRIPKFNVTGIKPGFNNPEENGKSAFKTITHNSFINQWKVIYFYPKDFTFICPTEILEFSLLNNQFNKLNTIVIGGNTDNEFCKLAWRRHHKDLNRLNQWSFADNGGLFMNSLGVCDINYNVALRATFIIDLKNTIQHISVNSLTVGRNPKEILRILDALQTGVNCGCNRKIGGETL